MNLSTQQLPWKHLTLLACAAQACYKELLYRRHLPYPTSCQAINKPFAGRSYTEKELQQALGDVLLKLQGLHYHDLADPAWFGLQDFKVLLLEKPGGTPKAQFTEQQGYRWYSQI